MSEGARRFRDEQLLGASFEHVDLTGARFDRVDLTGARLQMVDLADAEVRDTAIRNVRMRGVELQDVEINGELENVRVNGVDIGPLVTAELDRRHPERTRLRPTNAAGFREAWALLEELWAGTVDRARGLEAVDPDLLHEGVDGEWSFVETLRHLAFATSSWLHRAILGNPSPWQPLELRLGRSREVAAYLATLTDEQLAGQTPELTGTGWPPAGSRFPVKDCLDVLLNEEWWHRQFAERDLAVLETRQEETP